MGKVAKVNTPSESQVAKKQQKQRDLFSVSQAMKRNYTGISLFRRPPVKKA